MLIQATLLLTTLGFLVSAAPNCRCLYGQPCWPPTSAFALLSQSLSQPLIHPTPIALPCYQNASSDACSTVKARFTDALWRPDQPGGYEKQNFESYTQPNGTIDACYLSTSLGAPCKQGSIPPIGVDARTVKDIQVALEFVRKWNLRVVVKNTGHDYQGRGAGRGAFMIWTHRMKKITYDEKFVPVGGPKNVTFQAITTSAGDQWGDAYAFAAQHNRMLIGAFSLGGSVGTSGGFAMGGGISVFSPKYGLGIDNILQITIITANGTLLVLNAHTHTDLFWAHLGGGPGTFGVLTSVTYNTHPSFPVIIATFHVNLTSGGPDAAKKILVESIKNIPKFTDMGWGGLMYILRPTGMLNGLWAIPGPDPPQNVIRSLLDPYAHFINATSNGNGGIAYTTSSSFYTWYDQTFLGTSGPQVTGNILVGSRLLDRELAEKSTESVVDRILEVDSAFKGFEMVLGGKVSKPTSTGSINPVFRSSLASIFINEAWADGTNSTVINQQIERLKKNIGVLDGISKGSGSYMNSGSLFEKNFQKTFYAASYPRLLAIKKRYDPTSLFVVANGVGSEEWDRELVCRV
ncbi:FAD-binding domain-containing protein [Crepidotus variabilis]|uniref:FAD-binding domain-containing protein n=1 Tax=Crepidotus variabilis TaxID=179855 RepID=A0A9P6EMJ2_9AGAR|nr:FAD-binding domain-containing protein [Crepidotus variabilis]